MVRDYRFYRGYVSADPRFYEQLGRANLDYGLERQLLAIEGADVTVSSGQGVWTHCRPQTVPPLPPHGWKIHVSAVPDQVDTALAAVIAEFALAPFHFKCLRDRELVYAATSKWWTTGQVGKVITIYSHSAAECRALLERLHPALAGVTGPYVLTDRRYQDSTCLSYRYGEFDSVRRIEPNGTETALIIGPDGTEWIEDRRPVYRTPPWVPELFPGGEEAGDRATEHLINGYRVHKVLQHNGSGGVYLADRVSDGTTVVLKEARPHTAFAKDGSDAQQRLRKEYEALQVMAGTGIGPEPVELFSAWEHLFLAAEYLDGMMALNPFVARFNPLAQGRSTEESRAEYRDMCATVMSGLRAAVHGCHDQGLCFGDLSAGNVLIDPDTLRVRLIDFECARPLAGWKPDLPTTPGFTPPPGSSASRAGETLDEFGMAAIEQSLLFPINVLRVLNPDATAGATRHLAGLLDWPVDDLLDRVELPVRDDSRPHDLDVIVKESIRFIENVITVDRDDRVAPADAAVFTTNPWSVSHGVAGIVRALDVITGVVPAALLDWMSARRADLDQLPPGLYTGSAGVGWTLLDAGHTELGRVALDHALDRADAAVGFDVDSGIAGLGLAALAGWVTTSDESYRARAVAMGELLISSATDSGTGLYWPLPEPARRSKQPVGYAYGSSGVALFLLYLHQATGDDRYLAIGRRALNHDLAQATPRVDGGFGFPGRVDDAIRLPYWDAGTAGVMTALARYAKHTGSERYRTMLDRTVVSNLAGAAVFPGLFSGMAGIVNMALDCHTLFGDEHYAELAAEMAEVVSLFACLEPEGTVFPGTGLLRYSTDFATGSAGIALVFDRLNRRSADFNYTLDGLLAGTEVRHA